MTSSSQMPSPRVTDERKEVMTKMLRATADEMPGRFNIITGIIKAGGGDGEPMTLSGVASSSVEDLHGDRIDRSALKDMERQIASGGLAIFLNHSYKVPEDLAGFASSGKVVKRGEDADGNAVWDLDIEFEINDENPRAVETWRGIQKKKSKVGLSIGANIPPGGYEVDRKTGARTIKHISLLETSMVGIPANQRSWIAKALDAIGPDEVEDEALVLKSEDVAEAPPADDRDTDPALQDGADETSPDQPDVQMQDDSEPEAVSSDPGPEESKVDGPADPSEVASLESDPDPVEVLESLSGITEAVTVDHLQSAVEIGIALGARLAEARREVAEALVAKSEAERERDEMVRKTDAVIAQVDEIIKGLGDMPLGRKTTLKESGAKLDHLKGMYGPEFMKMLES
jgi:hypothetical protein